MNVEALIKVLKIVLSEDTKKNYLHAYIGEIFKLYFT